MDDAMSSGRPAAAWDAYTEYYLRLLEMPLPWDRSCTSIGRCPEGTRCGVPNAFPIVCDQGLLRDRMEPWLLSASGAARGFQREHPFGVLAIAAGLLLVLALAAFALALGLCNSVRRCQRHRRRIDRSIDKAGRARARRVQRWLRGAAPAGEGAADGAGGAETQHSEGGREAPGADELREPDSAVYLKDE